jgi:mono/diheme cytochrome c family protein
MMHMGKAMALRLLVGMIFEAVFLHTCAHAADRVLVLSFAGQQQRVTADDLLARSDVALLTIPNDPSYHRPMTYRVVPLLTLLGRPAADFAAFEARASDGFVSHLPAELVARGGSGGSVAWLAVEDPKALWPNLPGQATSAGPFYLVWEHPERSKIGTEQWPFNLSSLTGVDDPVRRWPQLAIDPSLPADAPERRGQAAFLTTCISCHRLKGAGESKLGPDLGQPMNVMEYMKEQGLRAIIRNPRLVRTWPEQHMPGLDSETVSDEDIVGLIAYLSYLGKHSAIEQSQHD